MLWAYARVWETTSSGVAYQLLCWLMQHFSLSFPSSEAGVGERRVGEELYEVRNLESGATLNNGGKVHFSD